MFVVPIMNNNRWSSTYVFYNRITRNASSAVVQNVSIVLPNFFVINCIYTGSNLLSFTLSYKLWRTKYGVDEISTLVSMNAEIRFIYIYIYIYSRFFYTFPNSYEWDRKTHKMLCFRFIVLKVLDGNTISHWLAYCVWPQSITLPLTRSIQYLLRPHQIIWQVR